MKTLSKQLAIDETPRQKPESATFSRPVRRRPCVRGVSADGGWFIVPYVIPLSLAVLCSVAGVLAADDAFPTPRNNDRDETAEPMEAGLAASTMQVPDGFRVDLFAAEPTVQNPIDMTWDARGRLWIAENYTYSDRSERFDLSLRDRVVVLEDADGDGQAEQRTVFVDNVQMLTSVEVGRGGVWLMCPPQLLFIPDADHDLVPDTNAVQVVLDGFTVAPENYHNFANGLRFGPDGWLYGRCGGSCPGRIGPPGTADEHRAALEGGIWRYHPVTGGYEVLTHGTTNPWGHDWDATGEGFFINTVNGHLWHLIPGAHFDRPFTLDPNPRTYELIDMHADHWHFDTTGAWHESRDGVANAYGGGHAHCGTMIYLADQWPAEYRGSLMTLNIHGQRINREILNRSGSGFVGSHAPDPVTSQDPFFRGMELMAGPDGSVFVIDWSDTGECHEHTGVHRTSGRVFRISYRQQPAKDAGQPNLYQATSQQLVAYQTHSNDWFARQSRLVLAERAEQTELPQEAVESLLAMVQSDDQTIAFRALVTLCCINQVDQEFLLRQLSHQNEHVRVWAIRLLTEHMPIDDCYGQLNAKPANGTPANRTPVPRESWSNEKTWQALSQLAVDEPSGLVRLTLASTLQRLPVSKRLQLATPLVQHAEDASDHNLPLLVWYGLIPVADQDPQALARLALVCRWPTTQRLITRRLAEGIGQDETALESVVAGIVDQADRQVQRNLLVGISEGLRGWRRATKPKGWDLMVGRLDFGDEESQRIVRELNVVFGDGRAIAEMGKIVLDNAAEPGLRRSALATLVANRGEGLKEICLKVLADPRLNVVAAEGLAGEADPEIADQFINNYRRFRSPERPKVISILCSRVSWATRLLGAIEQGKIPANDLTAFDVRQLRSLSDRQLDTLIARVWGATRETSQAKSQQIAEWKSKLTSSELANADLAAGRRLFQKTCQQCHRLYGDGVQVGPDLTGSNRNNLDYLLENIIDPSAVVGKDFRMTVLLLDDGRILNGLVVARLEQTLEMQTQTDRQVIDLDSIEESRVTDQSPMPEGLLDNLTPQQIRDLIGYLMHPSQVPLDE
ncbi:PVC-type heme-binding CxxCH protein [Planctomycetaceae bacterium SH139]